MEKAGFRAFIYSFSLSLSAIFAADDISSAVIDLKAKAEKVAESSVK